LLIKKKLIEYETPANIIAIGFDIEKYSTQTYKVDELIAKEMKKASINLENSQM